MILSKVVLGEKSYAVEADGEAWRPPPSEDGHPMHSVVANPAVMPMGNRNVQHLREIIIYNGEQADIELLITFRVDGSRLWD
mmetsp:Transcript_126427/g.404797  ORF Transcript_126427/g.404797 Transcript_126427/m.404797 type:complete len:82 (+) Transcript_126427:357-602(+)